MVYFDLYNTDANLGGMLPSDLDGPAPAAGTPNYFVQVDDNAWGYSPDQMQLWKFQVDWNNTANSKFTKDVVLPVTGFDSNMCGGARNCIPQPGGTKLDAIADRAMYRLQYRNFGSYQTLAFNNTIDVNSADRAGVRWYEVRRDTGAWSIYQQGTYSPDATHRWIASVAINGQGEYALGYTASSTSVYPSVKFTGREPNDPLGQMSLGENTIVAGTGYQTHSSGRWGDYSQMSVDPVDDCTFWYTQEYYATPNSSAGWQTRIGSFRFPLCGGTPNPTPTPTNTPTPGPTSTPTNTPTATNTPVPSTGMHIGDLDGKGTNTSSIRWKAEVTITVHAANHQALSGAQVSGGWSTGGTSSCTTGTGGTCTVTLSNLNRNRTSVTYTVNSVTKSGYTYQSASNHDPETDSNGTKITVNKP
jgi:hypothetical protein